MYFIIPKRWGKYRISEEENVELSGPSAVCARLNLNAFLFFKRVARRWTLSET